MRLLFNNFLDKINIVKQIDYYINDFLKYSYIPDYCIQQKMKKEISLRCQNALNDVFDKINLLSKENPHREIAAAKEIDGEFIWYNKNGEEIKDCIWRYVHFKTIEADLQYHPIINHNIHHVRLEEDFENMDVISHLNGKKRDLHPHQIKIILYGKLNPLPQKEIFVVDCEHNNFCDPNIDGCLEPAEFPNVTIVKEDNHE
jgi:hypothetical protein